MRFYLSSRAEADYDALPPRMQKAFDKQIVYLLRNLRHPSLHVKKYDEQLDRWQARVTRDYRFYFQIVDDVYIIVSISKHPK